MKKETSISFYFIGLEFYKTKISNDNFKFFATFEELEKILCETKFENKYILIKGSRGMALERIIDLL